MPDKMLREHTALQLAEELEFFRRHKSEWLPHRYGQFVVMAKNTFGGFHPTYDAALRAATRMFGLVTSFLIQKISDNDV
ncbi:MAG: hypothetical protein WA738_04440 [Candidatus Angelobacter sp.]